ncbi:cytoplasmic protein [Vararia minispora EC-137]|uniref:Cytoplasmic protein n=1 Tax=Vararia minispora EC-137 TaxID=1314806 RepID=A0ACB8QSA5_9AGAM|nr:cytoplasmic protein [Vararia minispora EC-137]
MSRVTPSSAKALQAILPLVESGQAYEAHQKARTFASRYQKAGQFDTAIDVLFQSARELLKSGQQGSGTDLALFLLDVYESKPETVSDESRGRTTQLISLVGPGQSWRRSIITAAIAWSAKHSPHPAGDPILHYYVGSLLYKEGDLEAAEQHLLNSGTRDSGRLLAQVFYDWARATDSISTHAGEFALRGTIPYLLDGNILAARTFLSAFLSHLPLADPPFRSSEPNPIPIGGDDAITFTGVPVLNFIQLLIRVIQRADGERNKPMREAWVRLCGTYQSRGRVLATGEVRAALNELASAYFEFPPPRTQNANPLAEMMAGMFGGPASGTGAPQRRVITPSGGLRLD